MIQRPPLQRVARELTQIHEADAGEQHVLEQGPGVQVLDHGRSSTDERIGLHERSNQAQRLQHRLPAQHEDERVGDADRGARRREGHEASPGRLAIPPLGDELEDEQAQDRGDRGDAAGRGPEETQKRRAGQQHVTAEARLCDHDTREQTHAQQAGLRVEIRVRRPRHDRIQRQQGRDDEGEQRRTEVGQDGVRGRRRERGEETVPGGDLQRAKAVHQRIQRAQVVEQAVRRPDVDEGPLVELEQLLDRRHLLAVMQRIELPGAEHVFVDIEQRLTEDCRGKHDSSQHARRREPELAAARPPERRSAHQHERAEEHQGHAARLHHAPLRECVLDLVGDGAQRREEEERRRPEGERALHVCARRAARPAQKVTEAGRVEQRQQDRPEQRDPGAVRAAHVAEHAGDLRPGPGQEQRQHERARRSEPLGKPARSGAQPADERVAGDGCQRDAALPRGPEPVQPIREDTRHDGDAAGRRKQRAHVVLEAGTHAQKPARAFAREQPRAVVTGEPDREHQPDEQEIQREAPRRIHALHQPEADGAVGITQERRARARQQHDGGAQRQEDTHARTGRGSTRLCCGVLAE
jgi:hypothetical protein